MPITQQQLLQILPNAGRQAGVFVPVLNTAMSRYGIVGTPRAAAFIAQVRHESGQLRLVREIWGPTAAQAGYEGRADLGNTVKGDGSKYRGRGPKSPAGPTTSRVGKPWAWTCSVSQSSSSCRSTPLCRRLGSGPPRD
jgi:predicted chitinase